MTGVRFADVELRPAEFLNLTSLTLEEFEVLVAPFEAAFQGRRGGSMGNPEPLHRLLDLPAGNARRSAVLPAHLPEDLRRSSGSGAAVRHEPEQSQRDRREVGGVALMEYDGPGVSATGDQEWGGYCAWWRSRGRWVALTCWRLTAPATLTTSRILACACRMASSS